MFLAGLAVLGVGLALPNALRMVVIGIGIAFLAVCVVALAMSSFKRVHGRLAIDDRSNYLTGGAPIGNLYVRWLDPHDPDELEAVFALRDELIPTGHAERELVKRRVMRTPELIQLIYIRHKNEFRLEGYCMMYPLSKSAVAEIISGDIRSGVAIRDRQILRHWRGVHGIYFASVAGRTRLAKIAVMGLANVMVSNYSPNWVFGRPVTSDSMRVMRRAGFVALFSETEIWGLDVVSRRSEDGNTARRPQVQDNVGAPGGE